MITEKIIQDWEDQFGTLARSFSMDREEFVGLKHTLEKLWRVARAADEVYKHITASTDAEHALVKALKALGEGVE